MDEYLDFAKQLAYKAGDIMLAHFQVGVPNEIKANAGDTPVTIADKAINDLVIVEVSKHFPTHSIIGEEASHEVDGAEWKWVCDPIDGTIPYIIGLPVNLFSLALVNNGDGQPVIAVAYDPYMKRLYSASKGDGAFLNDSPIKVNSMAVMQDALIGNSGGRSLIVQPAAFKASVINACFRPLILSCAVYEAMLVATGQIAAACFLGDGAHDAVSAKLIVEEAGGRVTSLLGEEQRYDQPIEGAMISNGLLHDELVAIVKNHLLTPTD